MPPSPESTLLLPSIICSFHLEVWLNPSWHEVLPDLDNNLLWTRPLNQKRQCSVCELFFFSFDTVWLLRRKCECRHVEGTWCHRQCIVDAPVGIALSSLSQFCHELTMFSGASQPLTSVPPSMRWQYFPTYRPVERTKYDKN